MTNSLCKVNKRVHFYIPSHLYFIQRTIYILGGFNQPILYFIAILHNLTCQLVDICNARVADYGRLIRAILAVLGRSAEKVVKNLEYFWQYILSTLSIEKIINNKYHIKEKKTWEPFRICLLNSTANPAQFGWKSATLFVHFEANIYTGYLIAQGKK